MIALVIICDFASLRTCTECQMPDCLSWGNVGIRDCSRRHVLRGSPLIGHRSEDAPDGVASWLARGLVLDVNEDGRVLRYGNGECESPA